MRPTAVMFLVFCTTAAARSSGADQKPGDVERGRVVFNQCVLCHGATATAEVPNSGPDLLGVMGRAAGSVPGYRYSRALRNARLIWTEETLDAFLADPQVAVPGNTMPFPGMAEETQRRDLIVYLRTLK